MSLDTSKLAGPYDVVFDVGAYVGDFARACLEAWPLARVHSFEPLVEVANIDGERWSWHRVALGADHDEIAVMHRCEFLPSSSMLPMAELHRRAFPYTRGGTVQKVVVHALEEYAHLIGGRTLLKIDVQGWELEVLIGAGVALDLFQAVVCEVSWEELYEGAPGFEQLDAHLRAHGFEHVARVDELRDPRLKAMGRLLQSDELWMRT